MVALIYVKRTFPAGLTVVKGCRPVSAYRFSFSRCMQRDTLDFQKFPVMRHERFQ